MEKRIDSPSTAYRAAALGLIALGKLPFGRVTASGTENIAASGPQILAYTHHNDWDTPLIGQAVYAHNRRLVHFWAKEELLDEARLSGKLLRSMHALPVKRGMPTKSQVRDAEAVVKSGGALALAAEGGRVDGDRVADIQIGAGFIAARQQVEILPVAVAGQNRRSLGKYRYYVPRPAHIHFGNVIPVEGSSKSERERISYQLGMDLQGALDTAYGAYEQIHGSPAAAQLDRGLTKLF